MQQTLEALGKQLVYVRIDPSDTKQLQTASDIEKVAFKTGIDPVELPEVLAYIAEHGHVWLQYAIETGNRIPKGVLELLPLEAALKFNPSQIQARGHINSSPLTVITKNRERAFSDVRKLADGNDSRIVYHHGIAVTTPGQGYGTSLLSFGFDNIPHVQNKATKNFIACFIDLATTEEGRQVLKPNEASYSLHMNGGFEVFGIVNPPVYDPSVTCLSLVRRTVNPAYVRTSEKWVTFDESNPVDTINQVRELLFQDYVGAQYDRRTHRMLFMKLSQYGSRRK